MVGLQNKLICKFLFIIHNGIKSFVAQRKSRGISKRRHLGFKSPSCIVVANLFLKKISLMECGIYKGEIIVFSFIFATRDFQ